MMLLPTTLVGSYPQPDWLIDRGMLAKRMPPRVPASGLRRVAPEWLEQAQDDATLLAIRDQERAGLDILTDGEMRRESYSNRFANALDGLDLDHPGTITSRSGQSVLVPRVIGKVRRKHPVQVRDVEFLRAWRSKSPFRALFTMTQQVLDTHWVDEIAYVLDHAVRRVNEETGDLFAAGADVVQPTSPTRKANWTTPVSLPSPPWIELSKESREQRRYIHALVTQRS